MRTSTVWEREITNRKSELWFLRLQLMHEVDWDPQECQGNLHVMVHDAPRLKIQGSEAQIHDFS